MSAGLVLLSFVNLIANCLCMEIRRVTWFSSTNETLLSFSTDSDYLLVTNNNFLIKKAFDYYTCSWFLSLVSKSDLTEQNAIQLVPDPQMLTLGCRSVLFPITSPSIHFLSKHSSDLVFPSEIVPALFHFHLLCQWHVSWLNWMKYIVGELYHEQAFAEWQVVSFVLLKIVTQKLGYIWKFCFGFSYHMLYTRKMVFSSRQVTFDQSLCDPKLDWATVCTSDQNDIPEPN